MPQGERKTFVEVEARCMEDGAIHPLCVIWGDGVRYPVKNVLDVRPGVSLPADGAGMCYTVCIGNSVTYLYRTGTRWFVKQKES